jgi:2-polyprenyl-6-methoxyphenol hydroxylase-like FAD-dependent oxidoreductase
VPGLAGHGTEAVAKAVVETPVLIVGAGPVGLTLALDLGWRGIPCTLIEQGDGTIEHPRTGLVAVRTMEFCRRWGIADRVRRCGFPDDYPLSIVFATSMTGALLDRDDYPSMHDMPLPSWAPEKKQRCPQLWLDPILKQAVREHPGVAVKFRWRLESFAELPDHVSAQVTDLATGASVEIRAGYMVGCDGAGSRVRAALDIAMEGNPKLNYSIAVLFRAPELLAHTDKGKAERYIFVGPEGTWGNITVVDGTEIWRLTILGSAEKFDLDAFDPVAWVRRGLGRDDVPFEIISVLPWRRAELVAAHFGTRRIFLAGDAVQIMSPTGGMGMNTGVAGAVDLAWKLAARVRGWGGPTLLDSYEVERKPVALRNLKFSTENFKGWILPQNCDAILDDTAEGAALRRKVGHVLKQALEPEWRCYGIQIGYRYEGSPICIPDGTPPTSDDYIDYVPTARPGARAPHAWLPDGRSTLDLFGRGFTLLCFDDAMGDSVAALQMVAQRRNLPLTVTTIEKQEIAALYELPLVLVRPDGHVAWRGRKVEDAEHIIDRVRGAA